MVFHMNAFPFQNYASPFPFLKDHMASLLLSSFPTRKKTLRLNKWKSATWNISHWGMTCHSIFLDNRDSVFYRFSVEGLFCCLNTTYINRFPHALPHSTVDLISILFLCPDTMVFEIIVKKTQTKFWFFSAWYDIQIFGDVSIFKRWGFSLMPTSKELVKFQMMTYIDMQCHWTVSKTYGWFFFFLKITECHIVVGLFL